MGEGGAVDVEVDVREGGGVEDGVGCLGGVGDEIVRVEVVDEGGEVGLGAALEGFDAVGGEKKGGVVGVGVDSRVRDGGGDVVDVEEEEGGGEG